MMSTAWISGRSSVNIGSPAIEPSAKIIVNSKIESWRMPRLPVLRNNKMIKQNIMVVRMTISAAKAHV